MITCLLSQIDTVDTGIFSMSQIYNLFYHVDSLSSESETKTQINAIRMKKWEFLLLFQVDFLYFTKLT